MSRVFCLWSSFDDLVMSPFAVGTRIARNIPSCGYSGLEAWGDWQGYELPVLTDGSSMLCRLWNQLGECSPRVN